MNNAHFYHKLVDIYLEEPPIRDMLLSNLSVNELLNLRATNREVKKICDSYMKRARKLKSLVLDRENFNAVLNSEMKFKFCEIYFNNVEIPAEAIGSLHPYLLHANSVIFEKCELSIDIGDIIDHCEQLENIIIDYPVGMLPTTTFFNNNVFKQSLPSMRIAVFHYESSIYEREIALLIFVNFLNMNNLRVLSMSMNVYIWFSKNAFCAESMVHSLHLRWLSSNECSDSDIIAALTTPVYHKILLQIDQLIYNKKKNIIEMLNLPFKIYDLE